MQELARGSILIEGSNCLVLGGDDQGEQGSVGKSTTMYAVQHRAHMPRQIGLACPWHVFEPLLSAALRHIPKINSTGLSLESLLNRFNFFIYPCHLFFRLLRIQKKAESKGGLYKYMHCCRISCTGVAPGSGCGAELHDRFRSPRYPQLEPT